MALLYGTKRTATVRSRDQCTIGALSEEDFNELIAIYPEIEKTLMVEARQYRDHWKLFQIDTLSRIDYFENLPFTLREDVHYKL